MEQRHREATIRHESAALAAKDRLRGGFTRGLPSPWGRGAGENRATSLRRSLRDYLFFPPPLFLVFWGGAYLK